MEALEAQLRMVGFALTPRMWTKTELSLIMVVLLDPHLKYMSINQKQGEEVLQNRYECAPTARIRMSVHHGKLTAAHACASVYTLAQSTLHAHKRQCTPWHTHRCTCMRMSVHFDTLTTARACAPVYTLAHPPLHAHALECTP